MARSPESTGYASDPIDVSKRPTAVTGRHFIVGCGRSGTTLLQSMLASHSAIASFPETWFFANVVGRHPARLYGWPPATVKDRLKRFRDSARFLAGRPDQKSRKNVQRYLRVLGREDLLCHFPGAGGSLQAQLAGCVSILDALGLDQNKPQWLEKSPLHLGYLDVIEKVVPGANFIHLLRDGSEVVASIYDASKRYPDEWGAKYPTLDHCITQWNHCVEMMRRHLHKPNHILVRYEATTDEPEHTLRRICKFMDIDYEPQMLLCYAATAQKMQIPEEQWKLNTCGPIRRSEKFSTVFTKGQQHYIQDRLKPLRDNEQFQGAVDG